MTLHCLALVQQAQVPEVRLKGGQAEGGWGSWMGSMQPALVCVLSAKWRASGSCQGFQRSSLSNCSTNKLRLINCMAPSGFKDPRCSVKLMAALSTLHLTPKENLQNIPEPYSQPSEHAQGSSASFRLDFSVQTPALNWCICVCACVYTHTQAFTFKRELIFPTGYKDTQPWPTAYIWNLPVVP